MAFISREDLRTPICTALYRLCTQNRDVLKVWQLGCSQLIFWDEREVGHCSAFVSDRTTVAADRSR